ncbi:hypothetical protein C5B96_05450 [Subtercola sp. Z020]|uniref:hypothetical protein n=1 Tax=Subtercola sp. Z020 TaxID=2080582 RepID=UPI000CE814FF|nr:hypothetical protein [Subtercola sp. Z020]PPF86179.1 hypothetical protein C5B96_05450 [Subtercola sp. Z020]
MTPSQLDLRELDPTHSFDLTPAEIDIRERTLHSVTAGAPTPRQPRRWSRSARSLFVVVPAAAACALVAGIVIGTLPGASHAPAASYALPAHGSLASWTATPQPSPVGADSLDACGLAIGIPPGTALSVLTSEKRGDFTSLIVHGGDTDAFCVLADGQVVNWTNFAGLRDHPLDDPNEASLSVLQGYEWMITVSGRAGADVTGVKVHNPDTGEDVTATVAGGVWSAWWPIEADSRASGGLFGAYGDDVFITYTTTDGQTHTETDDEASGDPAEAVSSTPPRLGSMTGWSEAAKAVVPSPGDVDLCRASRPAGSVDYSRDVLIAEMRGDVLTLVLNGDGQRLYCGIRDGTIAWSIDLGLPTTESPAAGDAYLTDGMGLDGDVAGTRVSAVRGVAGADVTGVTVHLADGVDVQATVQNGTWLAWWPEDEPAAIAAGSTPGPTGATETPAPAALPTITVTTRDGATHEAG